MIPSSSETVRVLPGMTPDTILVTAYGLNDKPLIRMEMPSDWLTPEWVTWMERLAAKKDPSQPSLQLLG